MITDKRLFQTLFIIQVFAAFLVVMGHYTAQIDSYTGMSRWDTILNHFSRFGTVILAILTGFFTAHSLHGKHTPAWPFFRGKFIYIVIPFLLAGFVYHFILIGGLPQTGGQFTDILLGKTGGHLYFIFMLCQYYIFAYVFGKRINRQTIFLFLAGFLIIQFAFIRYNFYWEGMGVRFFLPTWLFTIYLGHLLYEYRDEMLSFIMKRRDLFYGLLILAICSAVYFSLTITLYTANHLRFVVFTFVMVVSLASLIMPIVDRIKLKFRKGLTFYIYLFHPAIIIYGFRLFVGHLEWTWLITNPALSFVFLLFTFLLSYVLALGISSVVGMLVGRRRQGVSTVSKDFN